MAEPTSSWLGVDQGGVERELAQLGQGGQDRDPVAVEVVDQAQDALALLGQVGVVEPAVPGVEVDGEGLLLLGRQVGGDELLGAAQQERPDPLGEAAQRLVVALLLDRA